MRFNQIVMPGIIGLSFGVRVFYLSYINQHPVNGMLFAPLCGVDAHLYDQYGQDLLQGAWPGAAPLFRTPLYTLYLGLLYALFGVNHYIPLIVQSLIHALATAALYRIGAWSFSPQTGWLAACGLALYGSLIFYGGCFAQESLVVPLLILMLFFLLKFRQEGRAYDLLMAGLMLGLGALGRPTVLILLVGVVFWLMSPQKLGWPRPVYFVSAIILVLAPVTFHNYRVSGRFIPISTNGPEVLFISNNPAAEGRDILSPGIEQPAHRLWAEVNAAAERGETTLARAVFDYIKNEPLDWLELELKKLWLLFGKSDLNILTIAFVYPTTPKQIAIFEATPVQWPALIISALLGLVLIRPRYTGLLVLYFLSLSLATIIFFVQLRFRLLLLPVVLLYAAALLTQAPLWFRSVRRKFYLVSGVLLFFLPVAPEVWIFSLAFIVIGFWQKLRDRATRFFGKTGFLLLAAWSLLVILLLTAQIIRFTNRIGQSEDYYLGPEIAGDISLGQTFQPDCQGLNRVRFTLGVYDSTPNDQPVEFHLRSETTGQEIFAAEFTPEPGADRTIQEFNFAPQPDSKGQTYLAYFAAPGSQPGQGITLRGFSSLPVDWYPGGSTVAGRAGQIQALPGDLAFSAFCEATLWQTIDQAFAILPGSKLFYWGMLVGHTVLLVIALGMIWANYSPCQKRL